MELLVVKVLIALVPVVIFLVAFTMMDAFRLMSLGELLALLALGGVLAGASYFANSYLVHWHQLDELPIGGTNYTKYAAPLLEETMKASLVFILFLRNRIGFMVDAAITGFAIGAGFSLVENVVYLYDYAHQANLGVWLVRGFGTAVMHGSATAAFGVVGQFLTERRMKVEGARYRFHPGLFVPGWALAVLIHGAYNHFPQEPVLAMAVTLVLAPTSLALTFIKSEHSAHKWLLDEYETHEHLLEAIAAGHFDESEAGRFILSLSERFGPETTADAFEYLKVHTNLLATAEQSLIAHESDDLAEVSATDVRADFRTLLALERKLGRTALMAIRPHLHVSRHELWELHELQREAHAA
jgi:RsiW-degrading membrane proteinase PrsW (M82 family)